MKLLVVLMFVLTACTAVRSTPQSRVIAQPCATALQRVATRALPMMPLARIAGHDYYPLTTPTVKFGYVLLRVPVAEPWDDRLPLRLDCQDSPGGAQLTVTRPGAPLPPLVARALLDLF